MIDANTFQLALHFLEFNGILISGLIAYIATLKACIWMNNQFAPKRYAIISWMGAVIAASFCITCVLLLLDAIESLIIVPFIAIMLITVGLFAVYTNETLQEL